MRPLILLVLAVGLAGCSGSKKKPAGERASGQQQEPGSAQADADVLGREIFDLVDRAMSYKSAHRGRLPRSLKELGVDALTPITARTLVVSGSVPDVTVEFRAKPNHTLGSCHGTSSILEESSMGGGEFSVMCNLLAGGTTTLHTRR